MNYAKEAYKVSLCTSVVNAVLAAFKMAAGILGGSSALISDAVDSACDVFSSLIVMIGVKFASKSPDEDHPYGHERFECISSIVLALIIGATGLGVGWSAVGKILSGGDLQAPAAIALVAAAVSILAKEWMFRFTRRAAKRIQSDSLMANALNYRSDVFSSCGVLVGVAGAQLGFPVLDAVASLIICVLILKSALEILLDALSKMLDSSIDGETLEQMRDLVTAQPGVLALDDLKTRQFGSRYYVDVEIACDGDLTLRDAHAIAVQVHDAIEKQFPGTKHCLVHVNPFGEDHSH
ncbi:MAG TPA: cation diffusion facilitator family transporter [Firmicutes bacterium]|nr:cation diffusion facilitator family transporter [Bacillota bacterium]